MIHRGGRLTDWIVAGTAAACALALAACWLRSHRVTDTIMVTRDREGPGGRGSWMCSVESRSGGVIAHVMTDRVVWDLPETLAREGPASITHRSGGPEPYPHLGSHGVTRLLGVGAARIRQSTRYPDASPGVRSLEVSARSLVVPYWLMVLVALALPGHRGAKAVRAGRRAAAGRCRRCGYDLRATPARCPECGTHAPPARGRPPGPAPA